MRLGARAGAAVVLTAFVLPFVGAASPMCCGASKVLHELPCCAKTAGELVEPEFADCCGHAVDVPGDPRAETAPEPPVPPPALAVALAVASSTGPDRAPPHDPFLPGVERPPDRGVSRSTTVLLL